MKKMKQLRIILDVFKSGIRMFCEECGFERLINRGDGKSVLSALNDVELENNMDCNWSLSKDEKTRAVIVLELQEEGIHLTCEDTRTDEFIKHGDGNRLMELINEIEIDTHPDTTYTLSPKGLRYYELLQKGYSGEEAEILVEEEFAKKDENT